MIFIDSNNINKSACIAEVIFSNEKFKKELIKDFEITHCVDGSFIFNTKVVNLFIEFICNNNNIIKWDKKIEDKQRQEFSVDVVGNLMSMISNEYSYLVRFSNN